MNNPHWQDQHQWKIDDITFWLNEIWEFQKMLKRHPDDSMGDVFRSCIKELKMRLELSVKSYSNIYGRRPNMRKLREGVENA